MVASPLADDHRPLRRLHQYVRPDGRKLHVAASPEEANALRKQQGSEEFDLIIHGTPEHLDVVRTLHAHSEEKKKALQRNYSDVYDEFEKVHRELDALSTELSSLTDRSVALDANFSRYGYNANIRTREIGSKPGSRPTSRTPSLKSGAANDERRRGQSMSFWKRPAIRQYFHQGLIWRAEEKEEVAAFELFVDLLYVGIIAINGDRLAEDPTGMALLQFIITFVLSWKLWSELTQIVSWFETDDIFQRLCVLFFMACLTGFTLNIENAFGSTYTALIGFYLAQRFFQAIYFLWLAYLLPIIRGVMVGSVILILISATIWIGSIHVDGTQRLALIWVALPLELYGSSIFFSFIRNESEMGFLIWVKSHLQFYPAVNIEHRVERVSAFVTLVFGYTVVALLFQNKAPNGVNALSFFGKAILGLVQAFTFNMIYFEIDSSNIYTHAIRRHAYAYILWQNLHLPFVLGFTVASGALAKLVIAHDCIDADIETLAASSAQQSDAEIPTGLRWLYFGGLGIALLCMTGIALAHDHKIIDNLRFPKRHRLALRISVAVILLCLPLASALTSLQMIATSTGLVVLVLVVDLYGSTCTSDSFWKDETRCRYSAECQLGKKDLEEVKTGGLSGVLEISRRNVGEKGVPDVA